MTLCLDIKLGNVAFNINKTFIYKIVRISIGFHLGAAAHI